MAMKIQEKTVDKGDDVTFVGGVPRLKTKIDTRKSDLLEYMKFYQSCFRARKVEKEIKAIQDEKETELCLLLEYVNKQSDEIENLKQQIFDLTKSNIQQNAKSQASELNKLRDIRSIMEKLKNLNEALTCKQQLLEGVTCESRENPLEWLEKLKITAKLLNIKIEDISPSDSAALDKLAMTFQNSVAIIEEKRSLIAEIRYELDETLELAARLKYLEVTQLETEE
ncbi:hypothetical protein CHUAL_010594 [Chamberlinius hualienensis]